MTAFPLPAVFVEPPAAATASVIWLHGLGADGHDFAGIVPQLGLPDSHSIRFIFPHAPQRPVTVNNGYVMPAWYDIRQMNPLIEDEAGIRHTAEVLDACIAHETAAGIAASHIVLAGFSQGGAMALHTALRYPSTLAGVLALSTYLPLGDSLKLEAADANRKTPIWIAHGEDDSVIPMHYAVRSRARLQALGYSVDWHSYAMAHTVCAAEIVAIGKWLMQRLGQA